MLVAVLVDVPAGVASTSPARAATPADPGGLRGLTGSRGQAQDVLVLGWPGRPRCSEMKGPTAVTVASAR